MKEKLCLEIGPKGFNFSLSRYDKAIILLWVAETSLANVVWMRIITIKWRWPPVKCVEAFTES